MKNVVFTGEFFWGGSFFFGIRLGRKPKAGRWGFFLFRFKTCIGIGWEKKRTVPGIERGGDGCVEIRLEGPMYVYSFTEHMWKGGGVVGPWV